MAVPELTSRVVVALIGAPILVGVAYAGGWIFAGLLAAVATLIALEFYRLVEQKGIRPMRAIGATLAAVFVLLAGLEPQLGPEGTGFGTLMVMAMLTIATVGIWTRGVVGQPVLAASTTLTGAIYAGALLSFGLFLRHLPGHVGPVHGTALLFTPILFTWASDTFAYFVGRKWGTRKLIPKVSPGKTVEGAAGAVVGTVLVAIAYSELLLARYPTYRLGLGHAILLGVLISLAAQVGDLAESLFKREAGVKDSGTLLPGHGGAFDRFDSLLFTLPIGYLYFRFLVGETPVF